MPASRFIQRVLFAVLLWLPLWASAGDPIPGRTWERVSAPESLGWSGAKLRIADQFARRIGTEAYLVVEGGMLVHEYGSTSRATNVHSIRKSVLSLLIGIQVDRGVVALSASMAALDIDDRGGLSDAERQATVQHLLQARSGIYHPAAYESASMAARRPARGSHPPGTHFYYNNWDFNALGSIFHRLAGNTVFVALKDDLAEPLQFENWSYLEGMRFRYEPASDHPAYIMRLSARDMARIGLLVARKGMWGGRRIVSERWIAESLRSYSETPTSGVGYGYLWWIGLNGRHFRHSFPGEVVSARGSRGQYIVVDLAREIVIVHKVDTEAGDRRSVSGSEFAQLLKLIMDARS